MICATSVKLLVYGEADIKEEVIARGWFIPLKGWFIRLKGWFILTAPLDSAD